MCAWIFKALSTRTKRRARKLRKWKPQRKGQRHSWKHWRHPVCTSEACFLILHARERPGSLKRSQKSKRPRWTRRYPYKRDDGTPLLHASTPRFALGSKFSGSSRLSSPFRSFQSFHSLCSRLSFFRPSLQLQSFRDLSSVLLHESDLPQVVPHDHKAA